MTRLYRNESGYADINAERNLSGRTHYVDKDTLRCFRSRVLSSHAHAGGLLFSIIESMSLDYEHKTRGFRYVIFDLFGDVLERPKLEESFKTKDKAAAALMKVLPTIDAVKLTLERIKEQERRHKRDMDELRKDIKRVKS